MKAAIFCFSDAGESLAGKLCLLLGLDKRCIHTHIGDSMEKLFSESDALIFICACGIAVRKIAPFLKGKTTDPAVIVIDDQGKFVIPVLSGHMGGANRLSREIASLVGGTAVITTATDGAGKFSCDAWAAVNNCTISSMDAAKKVSAAILKNDIPVVSDYELPSPLPKGLVSGGSGDIGIYIGVHDKTPFKTTLRLIPHTLVLGIGCRKGTEKERLMSAIGKVLADNSLDIDAVGKIASVDVKEGEPGLRACAEELKAGLVFFSADELNKVKGDFEESDFVKKTVGTGNVCERSALIAGKKLIVKKSVIDGVTVAVAENDWEIRF